jgi:hypothetical protein
MRRIVWCALLFAASQAMGQDVLIKGRVLDSATRKPVSFASVVNSSQRGTSTNLDGQFSIPVRQAGETITISSIGYRKRTWRTRSEGNEILLAPGTTDMETIIVTPNDNQDPLALRIIRNAIDNRKINDPEELSGFSYNSYSKGVVDTLKRDGARKQANRVTAPTVNADTGRYQFMVESYFEHKYKKPGLYNNRMTAQRVSGLGNPFVIGLVTQIQYYSFYKDDFTMLGAAYYNPVSNKYYKRYVFNLVDSIRGMDDETVYIISFRPRYKSMGMNLMRGQVHIHGGDYAIVNVEASAYFSSSTSAISFKQTYERTQGHWFPSQLQTQLLLLPQEENERTNEQDAAVKFNVVSYLKDVVINPELKRSTFSNYSIVVDEQSGQRTDAYWNERRTVPLDMSEQRTYRHLDSMFRADPEIRKMNNRLDAVGYLASGKIPLGKFNIDLNEIVKLNGYENVRLGAGFSTNDRFSEHHKLGISGGYGFKDAAWKYGAYYEYKPSRDADLSFGILYRKDIHLWGISNLLRPGLDIRNYQYILSNRADDIRRLELYSRFRLMKKVEARAFLNWQERSFNHGYSYVAKGQTYPGATLYEGGLQLTTRFRQAKLKFGSLQLNGFRKDDPRLALDIRYGSGDGLNYFRIEGLYENNLNLGRAGKFWYTLSGGHISGPAPYALLFSNMGTGKRSFDVFVPGTFATMAPYEFTNTSYAALYTEFETGYILQKRKKWGISLFFPNSLGIGRYDQQNILHLNVVPRAMSQLYTETGMGLKFRSRTRTLGLAAMYRYGNYAASNFGDNLYFRLLVER